MSTALKNGLPYVTMAPGETLDWSRDWTDELEDGDTIADSVWDVPTGLAAGAESKSGPYTTQWVTSVAVGEFALVNEMTTTAGRKRRRTLLIGVVEAK